MTKGSGSETRRILQYHFLVWKDFQAPEYPAGILKFIRRMNEAYSLEKGPILVHCRYDSMLNCLSLFLFFSFLFFPFFFLRGEV